MTLVAEAELAGGGALAANIVHFARALREAGLPVGPGAVLDALTAVEAAGFGDREDFYATLHAVFVKKHEHSVLFDQAFRIFWKRRGLLEKLIAMMSPQAPGERKPARAEAGASRVADALFKARPNETKAIPSLDLDARFTASEREVLRTKDFAQMSAAEIDEARKLIKSLAMPEDKRRTRRFDASPHRFRIDARRSFRRSLTPGGAIDLKFRRPAARPPPIVALVDISGSMSEYTRLFLHFLHALGETRRVSTFLFGTRLTNVTRAMNARDVDDALARCSLLAVDWSGGTRIGEALARFNREWGRRVLSQGAIALLFTDGLERDEVDQLKSQMERLRKSSRRVIWVNPLLRFDGFSARAQGVRAMLPHVDSFRPIHNLESMADLCRALAQSPSLSEDPRAWLRERA
ncbi:MAG: VWA domain-containing protein [Hyphomicrobiales bacterium]|nr:VWA domain-containing protein [Hyphomicrobiales bacterium]